MTRRGSPGLEKRETLRQAQGRLWGATAKSPALRFAIGRATRRIDVSKEWDAVLLVLLDENFEATAIYEAPRAKVLEALSAPGSLARNERGALAVSKFKAIGKLRWPVKTLG